jgi:hypothetical protein
MAATAVVRLWSGLGNQLFQLAFGLAKAKRTGSRLVLEVAYGDRTFDKLQSFVDISDLEVAIMPSGFAGRLHRLFRRFSPLPYRSDRTWHYSPEAAAESAGRFVGYWQSEKYFEDFPGLIRQRIDLTKIPMNVPGGRDAGTSGILIVSVHIRRGDYLDERFGDRYNTVHEDYFRMAMELMRKLHPGAHFHLHSDDVDWVEQTYGAIADVEVIRGNNDLQDFRSMCECDHHILGNSTFSWWAAWLNPNPDKIVIMPKQWSNVPNRKIDDIYMKGAIILNP